MKKIKLILKCWTNVIKKKIFKSEKTEICQECKEALNIEDEITSIEELKLTEEYAIDYNVTTRWQTL
jgi:hypothetical protein